MQKPSSKDAHPRTQPTDPAHGSLKYQDRPADEGKHGDAAEEPTEAPLGNGEQQKAPQVTQD
jgi:hypothetical protein